MLFYYEVVKIKKFIRSVTVRESYTLGYELSRFSSLPGTKDSLCMWS